MFKTAFEQDLGRLPETKMGGGLIFTGDRESVTVRVKLIRDGAGVNLTGCTAIAKAIRADGNTVQWNGYISGDTANASLPESCYTQAGPLALMLQVVQGGHKTTVLKVIYNVTLGSSGETIDPGSVVPDLSDLMAMMDAMETATNAANTAAEGANAAATQDVKSAYIDGDMKPTGRGYQTLRTANFTRAVQGKYMHVISGNVGQAMEDTAAGWDIYEYQFGQRLRFRLDELTKNSAIQGDPGIMAARLGSGSSAVYYTIDLDRAAGYGGASGYFVADALRVNYNPQLGFSFNDISISYTACREFEDAIVCGPHRGEFDRIVVFGDSIFANWISYINGTAPGANQTKGVIAQLAALTGLPVTNNAVAGATLSTKYTAKKNVVQQIADYITGRTPEGVPMYLIGGGTNDQANYHLTNLGTYGSDDQTTVYGAIKAAVNLLLGFGAQPWQIVIATPIPKGIRAINLPTGTSGAEYVAGLDSELTTVGYAMFETGVAQMCNVINGFHSVFKNLDAPESRFLMMADDTHPTEYGAKMFASYLYQQLSGGGAARAELISGDDYNIIL